MARVFSEGYVNLDERLGLPQGTISILDNQRENNGQNRSLTPAEANFAAMSAIWEHNYQKQKREEENSLLNQFKDTETFKFLFNNEEDELKEAKEINALTGLPVNSILYDGETKTKAREIYRTAKSLRELGVDTLSDVNFEELYKRYPGLEEVKNKSSAEGALVLKNLHNIKLIHNSIEAASVRLKRGSLQSDLDRLYTRKYSGLGLGEEEAKRIREIEEQLKELPEEDPNIFSRGFSGIVGATAEQLPRRWEANKKGLAAAGAVSGSMTLYGAAAGAVAGGVGAGPGAAAGFVTSLPWAFRAYQAAMFGDFTYESIGRYAEGYAQLRDEKGRRVYTDEQALLAAIPQAVVESGIETVSMGAMGKVVFGKMIPRQVAEAVGKRVLTERASIQLTGIISTAPTAELAKTGARGVAVEWVKGIGKVAGIEVGEEMAQEAASGVIDNMYTFMNRRAGYDLDYTSIKTLAVQSLEAGVQALPAAVGFGILGGTIKASGAAYKLHKANSIIGTELEGIQRNIEGIAQLESLKNAAGAIKDLHAKAPDAARVMIQAKLDEVGNSKWFVDTELLLQEENGRAALIDLAEKQSLKPDEIQALIDTGANLEVDSYICAQAINEADFGETVKRHITMSEGVPTVARAEEIKIRAENLTRIVVGDAQKEAKLLGKYIKTVFPQEGLEQDMAATAVFTSPQNPAQGWRQLFNDLRGERDALLAPYLNYLNETGRQGVEIIREESEYGQDNFIRVSNNDSWYSDFYRNNNRPPTREEMNGIAYDMAIGNTPNPVNYGVPSEILEETKNNLDRVNREIDVLNTIKDRLMTMKASEITITKDLTTEGYQVYQDVIARLDHVVKNKEAKKANRMGAIIFARFADRYASVMRETGHEDYTALDYARSVLITDKPTEISAAAQKFEQASKLSEAKNIREFIDEIAALNGDKSKISKKRFEFTTNKGAIVTLLGSDFWHIQTGTHPLTVEQWETAFDNIENVEYAVGDNVRGSHSGKPIHLKIQTPTGKAGVLAEFINNGRIVISTAVFNNDAAIDNWAKNKKSSYTLGIETDTAQDRIAGNSSIFSIIQEKLGIIKEKEEHQQDNRGTIQIFKNGQRIISLFKTADRSTFLHEMGHLAAAELKVLAEIENAPEWIKKDWETVKAALDWKNGQKDFTKKQQEKMAGWFEAYLISGEAPTRGLKAVFRQFKKWLVQKYTDFTRIGRATPEVEAVMSRMLASQEEIDTSLEFAEINAFQKANGLDGLLLHSANMYERWQTEIAEETKEKLLAFIMKDLKETDAERLKNDLAKERENYIEEMMKMPIWRNNRIVESASDKGSVIRALGYSSVEVYEKALKDAGGSFDKAINKHVENYKNNLANPVMDDMALEEKAKELLTSSKYADMLVAFEYEALRGKIYQEQANKLQAAHILHNNVTSLAKAAELFAQGKMRSLGVAQATNVNMWLNKAKQQDKKAIAALVKNEFRIALEAKSLQLSYLAMAKQALENKKTVDSKINRIKNRYQKINKQTTTFPVAEQYHYSAIAYRLGLVAQNPTHPVTEVPSLEKLFMSYHEQNEVVGGLPDWVVADYSNPQANMTYGKMTMDDFGVMADVLGILYKNGKDSNKLKTRPNEDYNASVENLAQHIYAATSHQINRYTVAEDTGLPGGILNKYLNSIMKPEVILEALDGGKGGMLHEYLYNTYDKAFRNELSRGAQASKQTKEIFKNYSNRELWDMANNPVYEMPGGEPAITKETLIMIALNWGNPINRDRVMNGHNLTAQEVTGLLSNLDERDNKLVNDIWDFINEFWPETVAVEERMNGTTLKKVEAEPFAITDKNGQVHTYKGGYFPIAYNVAKSKRASDFRQDDLAKQMMTHRTTLGTGLGFTKGRTEASIKERPLLLSFDVLSTHISGVLHNITIREAARDVNKIINDRRIAQAITDKLGQDAYQVLQQWAKDAWSAEAANANDRGTERIIRRFRLASNVAIMGYRLSTSLLNAANIAPMMKKMGAADAFGAVVDFYGNASQNFEFVMQNSVSLANRIKSADATLREMAGQKKMSKYETVNKIKDHAYDILTWTDLMLSMPAWLATYNKVYNSQVKEGVATDAQIKEKAVSEADKVVREIFGSGLVIDQAKIQKGGELNKALTPFYSFFSAQINVFLESWLQARNTGNYKEVFRTVMYNFILMSAIETIIRSLWEDDDDASFIETWSKNFLSNAAGGFVGVRDAVEIGLSLAYDGKIYGKGVPTSLYQQAYERGAAFGSTAVSVLSGKGTKDFIDLGADFSKVVTSVYGFPDVIPNAFWNSLRWWGNDFDADMWDYLRANAFGKKLKK